MSTTEDDEVKKDALPINNSTAMAPNADDNDDEILEHHPLVIVGGGIGGLVLALCLDQVYNHNHHGGGNNNSTQDNDNKSDTRHPNPLRPHLPIHVYESTSTYTSNAGGAIGLYPNGLRVLRNLSQTHPQLSNLLLNVRAAGCDYLYRRWMRHDGFEVAVAREDELLPDVVVMVDNDETIIPNVPSCAEIQEEENEERGEEDGENSTTTNSQKAPTSPHESQQQQVKVPRSRNTSMISIPLSTTTTTSSSYQDKAGERANRRPRGGTLRILQDRFQNLTTVGTTTIHPPSTTATATTTAPTTDATSTDSNTTNSTTPIVASSSSSVDTSCPQSSSNNEVSPTSTTTLTSTKSSSFASSLTTTSPQGMRNSSSNSSAKSSIVVNSSDGRRSTSSTESSNTNRWREALKSFGDNAKSLVGVTTTTSRRSSSTSTSSTYTSHAPSSSTPSSPRVTVETELLSLGIRRWRYQQVLYEACRDAGIQIHFGKRLESVASLHSTPVDANHDIDAATATKRSKDGDGPRVLLQFKDGTKITTSLLIGADGINSRVRKYVTHPTTIIPSSSSSTTTKTSSSSSSTTTTNFEQSLKIESGKEVGGAEGGEQEYVPAYTGVTCLMGCANVPRPVRGICFPSSATTKCHACYYPTRIPSSNVMGGIDVNNSWRSATEPSSVIPSSDNPKSENRDDNNDDDDDDDDDDYEQVFQIFFPSPIERPDTWRTLTPTEAREECRALATKLRNDGWHEQFLMPLESPTLTGVLRVGLRTRDSLDRWHVGGGGGGGGGGGDTDASTTGAITDPTAGEGPVDNNDVKQTKNQSVRNNAVGCAVLLGDAAHPPVPYIGQGAMMAMEDAGTLSILLGHYCPVRELVKECDVISSEEATDAADEDLGNGTHVPQRTATATSLDLSQFSKAMSIYESLRVSRTKAILGSSVALGKTQQKRADSKLYNAWREMSIRAQVWAYGTLPVMRPGAAFDYKNAVEEAMANNINN